MDSRIFWEELAKLAATPEQPAKTASRIPWIASQGAEHVTDLAGLGMMAGASVDKLRRQLSGTPEEHGETGRVVADTAGLTTMTVPTLAALGSRRLTEHHAGGGSRLTNAVNAAGLGSLLLSAGDKLQARLRSAKGEDPEQKQLMGHTGHAVADLAGLGILSAPAIARVMRRQGSWGDLSQLAGYGTLAAPVADDLQAHLRTPHGQDENKKKIFGQGAGRTLSELAGLAMLAAPSAHHLAGGH